MIYIYAIQIYDFYALYSIGIIAIQLCARLLFVIFSAGPAQQISLDLNTDVVTFV